MAVKKTEKKGVGCRGKPGPGRPKGVPNKATTEIRKAIVEAFDKAGGVDYLVNLAQTEPKTFIPLLAKVVPTVHEGGDNPIEHVHIIERKLVKVRD